MNLQDRDTLKEQLRQAISTHLADIHERTGELLSARDPFSVYNAVHTLRSLVGQLDSASRRYRELA